MPVWLEDNTCIRADDALALLVRAEPPVGGVGIGRLTVLIWLTDVPNALPIAQCASPSAAIQKVEEIRGILEEGKKLTLIAPGVAVLGEKVKGFGIKQEAKALPWGVQIEVEGAGTFLVVRCNSLEVAEGEIARMAELLNADDKIIYDLGNNTFVRRENIDCISVRAAPEGKKILQVKLDGRESLLPIIELAGDAELAAHMEQLSKTLNADKGPDERFALLPCGWGFLASHLRLMQVRAVESREQGRLWHVVALHEKMEQPAVLSTHSEEAGARAALARYADVIKAMAKEEEEEEEESEEEEED